MQMRLVDGDGNVVKIGDEGEIQVRTYSAFKEYRAQPEKTKSMFMEDGFLKTGYGQFVTGGVMVDLVSQRLSYFVVTWELCTQTDHS